jgi:hypothetical protein
MAELTYTLEHKKDIYTVLTSSATYVLTKLGACVPDEILESSVFNTSYVIPLTLDGDYHLNMKAGGDESNIYIKYYLTLQLSMIEDIYTVLCPCDCGCANCTDLSIDQYKALLVTRNKIDVLKYVVSPQYDASFQLIHEDTNCLIEPQLYCDIATEGITGETQYNATLTKQLIALDYLAMYFTDLREVTDVDEIAYIKDKYKSEAILCCINKLGIDINGVQTTIDNMASGIITSAVYVDLPPTDVGFLDINVANRAIDEPLTVTDFTENVASYPPAAGDPNPDPANNLFYAIKIDTILVGAPLGMLQYNGVDVIVGQVITFADIALSKLTYTSPDIDPVDTDTFTYSVSNVGVPTTFIS